MEVAEVAGAHLHQCATAGLRHTTCIVFVDEGQVREAGSHEELMRNVGGP